MLQHILHHSLQCFSSRCCRQNRLKMAIVRLGHPKGVYIDRTAMVRVSRRRRARLRWQLCIPTVMVNVQWNNSIVSINYCIDKVSHWRHDHWLPLCFDTTVRWRDSTTSDICITTRDDVISRAKSFAGSFEACARY